MENMTAAPSADCMSIDELKAWIAAEGCEQLDQFAQNCWADKVSED